jgi:uncharacterized membrane protein
MSKFVVTTFANEAKAYDGVSALNELHTEGSITLYGTVVVQRGTDGQIDTKQHTPAAAVGGGLGSLCGALVGALGGPLGAAIGLAAGGAAGSLGGFVHGRVSDEFLEDVTKELKPGMFAVLAEVSEDWTAPIDTRMDVLGGKVLREYRSDVVDDILEKRAQARRAWLEEKKAAHQTRKAERLETKLEQEIIDARDMLQRTAEKARKSLDETKQEMTHKLNTLEQQAAKAKPETKKQIDERIAQIRQEFGAREQKLSHAWDLAQQALQP